MSSIPKLLKLKDYITLSGTVLGIIAIICAVVGHRYFLSWGFFLLLICIVTDLADGYVARKTGTVNQIGKELDSLSDCLTFGIAPAILIFESFRRGGYYDFAIIIGATCFAVAALLRLARFNLAEAPEYTGLPTPLSAFLVIIFFYANYFQAFALGGGGEKGLVYPFAEISYYVCPFLLVLIAWLNITTHIGFGKKNKKVYTLFFTLLPICVIVAIIGVINPTSIVSMVVSIILTIAMLFFLGVVLFYGAYIQARVKAQKSVEKKEK